jgi:type IV fimbrial biogenesis protein FimT
MHDSSCASSRQGGATIIELVVVIAVVAILCGWAVPGFGAFMESVRLSRASSELSVDLATARMLAVERARPVTLCPTHDGRACSGSAHWSGGWMSYVEGARIGTREPDEERLQVVLRQDDGVRVIGRSGRVRVTFQPDGTSGGSNTTLDVCSRAGSTAPGRRLVLSNVGRLRAVERVAAAVCGAP